MPVYRLDSCDGLITFYADNAILGTLLNPVIQIYPSYLPQGPIPGLNTGVPFIISPGALTQYQLTNCCDPNDIFIVSDNLINYLGQTISAQINTISPQCYIVGNFNGVGVTAGSVITLNSYTYNGQNFNSPCLHCQNAYPCLTGTFTPLITQPTCFTISASLNTSAITLTLPNDLLTATDCFGPLCNPNYLVPYVLQDCAGVEANIITTTDLSSYTNVVQIAGKPNVCWVRAVTTSSVGAVPVTVTNDFNNCLTCLAAIPPIPVPTPNPFIKGKTSIGYSSVNDCLTTEYIEKVNCTFAAEVYNQMIVKRYGITMKSNIDMDTWDIKKQILNYDLLVDSSLCIPDVVPPVNLCVQ